MRAYVLTTGVLFGLLTVAHILRIIMESPQLARDPWYVLITFLTAALGVWAWRLIAVRYPQDIAPVDVRSQADRQHDEDQT